MVSWSNSITMKKGKRCSIKVWRRLVEQEDSKQGVSWRKISSEKKWKVAKMPSTSPISMKIYIVVAEEESISSSSTQSNSSSFSPYSFYLSPSPQHPSNSPKTSSLTWSSSSSPSFFSFGCGLDSFHRFSRAIP